jgi:hypothetical protein
VRVVRIWFRHPVIRELAVGVEWRCRVGGLINSLGYEQLSRWKFFGSRLTWHVLWASGLLRPFKNDGVVRYNPSVNFIGGGSQNFINWSVKEIFIGR